MRWISGFLFGAGISLLNFFLLTRWVMRLGNLRKPSPPFLLAFFSRYLLLFFGIFVIVSGKWVDRLGGLLGLALMYFGLLAYEFARLKRKGD